MTTARKNVWLGIYRPPSAGKYQFYYDNDNTLITWTKWGVSYPRSESKISYVVAYDLRGQGHKWLNRGDTSEFFYFCELA